MVAAFIARVLGTCSTFAATGYVTVAHMHTLATQRDINTVPVCRGTPGDDLEMSLG